MTIKYTETHKKIINGYLCEVEIDSTQEPETQGWITKGSFGGSLDRAFQLGYLTTTDGEEEHEILDRILHRIEEWAGSVGY